MTRNLRVLWMASLAALLGVVATARPASADPIGPNCGSCAGAIYTLQYFGSPLPDVDPLHETFRISLLVDTNTYSGGGTFLDNAAIKVSNSFFDAVIVSAPSGVANWSEVDGGIDSGGCSGSGSGFACVNGLANGGKGVAVTTGNGPGPDYSFVFDITVDNGTLFTGVNEASIKARYVDSSGAQKGALLSENITLQDPPPVPEPDALVLIGTALAGLGSYRLIRRRCRQA